MKQRTLSALITIVVICLAASGCKQVRKFLGSDTKVAQAFNAKIVEANRTINRAAVEFGKHLRPVLAGSKPNVATLDAKFAALKSALERVEKEMKQLKVPDLEGAKELYEAHQRFLVGQRAIIDGTLKTILDVAKDAKLDLQAKREKMAKLFPEISKREGTDLNVLREVQRSFAKKNRLQLR